MWVNLIYRPTPFSTLASLFILSNISVLEKLIDQILELEKISEALEPTETERNEYNSQVNGFANQFINTIHEVKTFSQKKPNKTALSITNKAGSLQDLLSIYQSEVVESGLNPASGGHIGYIPGGGLYTSAIGDYLADVSNEYAGMQFGSPGAVAIEDETLNWMKTLFGFPASAIGNLTSGGSIANLIALTAARDKFQIKNERIRNSVLYISPQVHHCIQKAIRIIGLEDVVIQYLELDDYHRIDSSKLDEQIKADKEKGLNPFLVIASAGTTDTGAVDPLKEIGNIAQEHNLWYHVDAAYGGFFILADQKKERFNGIEMADSLVIDPHKGLFLPYGIGAVLVKDKEAVFHSHHYTANYMQDANKEDSVINPADVSPELTKHFRGLRMWLPLRLHGLKPFVACLEEKLLLTDYFRNRLVEKGFKIGPEPDLSVSYFWYPSGGDENAFNEKLMKEIHKDGSVFLSSTKIKERFVIRIAILSFRTKKHTIDRAMDMITSALQRVQEN